MKNASRSIFNSNKIIAPNKPRQKYESKIMRVIFILATLIILPIYFKKGLEAATATPLPATAEDNNYTYFTFPSGWIVSGLNDNDQVLAWDYYNNSKFIYDTRTGSRIELPNTISTATGEKEAVYLRLNARGQILLQYLDILDGYRYYYRHAIYDSITKKTIQIPETQSIITSLLTPNSNVYANGINNLGAVSISAFTSDPTTGLTTSLFNLIYQDGTYESAPCRTTATRFIAINDNKAMVLSENFPSASTLYFQGKCTSMPPPPGALYTIPIGITNGGQVAGYYRQSDSDPERVFLYNIVNNSYQLFRYPQSIRTDIRAINNNGSIMGVYYNYNSGPFYLGIPKRPSISIVDPIYSGASLLRGNRIFTPDPQQPDNLRQLSTGGRTVQGIAADGVAQVIVKIPAKNVGEPVSVKIKDGQCNTTGAACIDSFGRVVDLMKQTDAIYTNTPDANSTVTATAQSTPLGPMAFVSYRAPSDFVRTDNGTGLKPEASLAKRTVTLTITSQQTNVSQDFDVTVVRPPVALIHGNWSDQRAWNAFKPLSNNSDPQGRFTAYRPDYSATMSAGIQANVPVVVGQLVGMLNTYRMQNNVAATQFDAVGYSMGGLIARGAMRWAPSFNFTNFSRGPFHKLITLDTPHIGSEFASSLLNGTSTCKSLFEITSGNLIGKNITDLAPLSYFLNSINFLGEPAPAHIPTHAIYSSANDQQLAAAERKWGLKLLSYACPFAFPSGGYGNLLGQGNDLVVSKLSQSAWTSNRYSKIIPSTQLPANAIHAVNPSVYPQGPDVLGRDISNGVIVDAAQNFVQLIVQDVIKYLNSPVAGSDYAQISP